MRVSWGKVVQIKSEQHKGKNIGEWSEILAILYCLASPTICIDGHTKRISSIEYNGIKLHSSNASFLKIQNAQHELYQVMHHKSDTGGSFDVPDNLKQMLTTLGFQANSKASINQKHDIVLNIENETNPYNFNIKSLLGGDPSIINASQQTSIKYVLKNPTASIDQINCEIDAQISFSNKIKYLRSICEDINSNTYTSEAYRNVLSNLDEYAFLYMADWLLKFFEHKQHGFLQTDVDLEWFNKFIIMSMTKIKPKSGTDMTECGIAFLYSIEDAPQLYFTMGADTELSHRIYQYVKFERPSFNRHKKYMLGEIAPDYSFRLPIQIRLQSKIRNEFK